MDRGLATVREVLLAFAVLALVGGGYLLISGGGAEDPDRPGASGPDIPSIHAESVGGRGRPVQRQTIYKPPQAGGYTSWVGAWLMPDDSVMTAFTQATGPIDPRRRKLTPARVRAAFGPLPLDEEPERDFWGLDLAVKYLRSTDRGQTWRETRSDSYQAIRPQPYTPQPTLALHDGTIVRRVNGEDLRQDPSIPHTAFLQRLEGGRWSRPQVLMDPARFTSQITRIRYLRDGRLLATGNYWKVPASVLRSERASVPSQFLLMVSSDDGRTWKDVLTVPEDVGYLPANEWDTAELPSGDLVAVIRTSDAPDTRRQVRKQALLVERDGGWEMTEVKAAPFPHSGHPELLASREGPVLNIATTGIHYTKDGRTWTPLRFSPPLDYKSTYYPRSVQGPDGTVYVFGHHGADDPYGTRTQSITLDRFRLVRDAR